MLIYRKRGLNVYKPDICSKNLNELFTKYKYYFFFLDLNDCFALTEISSLKNTQMIGICWFRSSPSYSIENCKTHCLYDSRCVGVNPTGHCIEYMYQAVTSRCHFPRTAIHFIHKGNHIVSYLIKFLFNVSNHAPVRKDA